MSTATVARAGASQGLRASVSQGLRASVSQGLCCDAAQLQLELRDLAVLVPTSAFRLGELASRVRGDPDALPQLAAYLEFIQAVPTPRCDGFATAVRECLRLTATAQES